ncbi:hypothetical protein [Candidatus Tisiphia endosymbiont of Nemotelus uliginosus]|uniref:hypothetical protein n=1 Tax=Candidatus Tisiphia endosymbiont of Nemotelus uliginosus TaxID=3077926 RepID=UPI0035C8C7D4
MIKIDQIVPVIQNLKKEYSQLFNNAVGSFISEIIDPDNFDEILTDINSNEILNQIDSELANSLFCCATEFFLSNEYPHRITKKHWNCIDHLLKTQEGSFNDLERKYLLGLRDSYMNLYQVKAIQNGKIITVSNMIESKQQPIIVQDVLGSQNMDIGNIIGCRIVKVDQDYLLSSVCLTLTDEAAAGAVKMIKQISKMALTKDNLRLYSKHYKDPELMLKKMWAKEITEQWFLCNNKTYMLN